MGRRRLRFPAGKESVDLPGYEGDTFTMWDGCARAGCRGLSGGSSLAEILGLPRMPVTKLGDALDPEWFHNYELLKDVCEENEFGLLQVRCGTETPEGERIGRWFAAQLALYRKHSLAPERLDLLQTLPGWDPSCTSLRDFSLRCWVAVLRKYISEYGHPPFGSPNDSYSGYKLSSWVALQRRSFREGSLSPETQELLESIPGWTWDSWAQYKWKRNLQEVRTWLREHKTISRDASKPDRTASGLNLTSWYYMLAARSKEGSLSREQKDDLESLGIHFNHREVWSFAEFLETLRDALRTSHLAHVDSETLLDKIKRVRESYRSDTLPRDQCQQLEATEGWFWSAKEATQDFKKREARKRIEAFMLEHGEASLWKTTALEGRTQVREDLRQLPIEEVPLGDPDLLEYPFHSARDLWFIRHEFPPRNEWPQIGEGSEHIANSIRRVLLLRARRKSGTLPREVLDALEAIPGFVEWAEETLGDTEPESEESWQRGYKAICAWTRKHSLADLRRVKTRQAAELREWLHLQRKKKEEGVLTRGRQRKLEKLRHWAWTGHGIQWRRGLEELQSYVKKYRTQPVSRTRWPNDFPLGPWINTVRTAYSRGKLSKERIAEIEQVPGWRWQIGVEAGNPRKKTTSQKKAQEIKRLFKKGATVEVVARKTRSSVHTVRWVLGLP